MNDLFANKRIIIAGASGFGREVAWVLKRMDHGAEIAGFCDDDPGKAEFVEEVAPYLGGVEETIASYADCSFFCAIGNNQIRKKVCSLFVEAGVDIAKVIDPSSVVAPKVVVGAGSFIGINSVVSVSCSIGSGVIINHNVTVGHDVNVQDFAQLCPGVCVSGGCEIGEGALLGTLAGTIPLKRIGAWATLGAGVTTLRNVPDGTSMIRLGARAGKSEASAR